MINTYNRDFEEATKKLVEYVKSAPLSYHDKKAIDLFKLEPLLGQGRETYRLLIQKALEENLLHRKFVVLNVSQIKRYVVSEGGDLDEVLKTAEKSGINPALLYLETLYVVPDPHSLIRHLQKSEDKKTYTREEAIEEACKVYSLVYHSLSLSDEAQDGYCQKCAKLQKDQNYPEYRNSGPTFDFVREAVVEKLKREGYRIPKGYCPETGIPLEDLKSN
jgi:hypothetical protein